jgi:hypothetical protein
VNVASLDSNQVTLLNTELWEEEFRKLNSIKQKLNGVTKLLTGETFCSFLERRPDVLSGLKQLYPNVEGQPWTIFEDLFRKRNKILHSGKVQFDKPEAEACFKLGITLLQILAEADRERFEASAFC